MKMYVFPLVVLFLFSVANAADLKEGEELYQKFCSQCHGEKGDGQGPGASRFLPLPRDFTTGKYKVRTTASGELPTDQDIADAIKKGLAFKADGAYTGMPPWPYFSDDEIMSLVVYLKTFTPDFEDPDYNNPKPINIPAPKESTPESIEQGRKIFEANECIKCHGEFGRGDGRSAPTLKDDAGKPIRPVDLTKRFAFRGGGTKEDLYRTISTGFNGTPMPSYADTISEEDRLHMVNYIFSLSDRDTPNYSQPDSPVVVTPAATSIDISDIEKAKGSFSNAPVSIIPIVGQVVEPGREFFPGANEINVQAVYNQDEIAFLLTWHDMQENTSGENRPDMEVPMFADEVAEEPPEEESDDPFADVDDAEDEDPFADEEDDPFADEEAEEGPQFSDAIAIQLPLKPPAQGVFKKPYFIFGDSTNPVHLWHRDLAQSSTNLYLGKGSGSLKLENEHGVESTAKYEGGVWTVAFKRARTIEGGPSFDNEGSFIPVAFSTWDGINEERGNKRGLTTWFSLYLKPFKEPSPIGPMLMWGLGILLLEIIIVVAARRSKKE